MPRAQAYLVAGGHRLQQLGGAVEDAGAGWAEHLVTAEGRKVAAERLRVDALVRSALRAIDQNGRAGGFGRGHHLPGGVDRPQRVADLSERNQPRRMLEQLVELVLPQLASLVDVDELDEGSVGRRESLPRDDVGWVIEDGEHYQVARPDVPAAPRVGDHVDGLGRAARGDD